MPNTKRTLIKIAIESMVASVKNSEDYINELNVFPIPDGDTGSNMSGTLIAAYNNISVASMTDLEVLNDFSRGALLGARGNSGVITSQIIKGFYEGTKINGKLSWEKEDFKKIIESSKYYAYKAVSDPVEGTILSVLKAMDNDYTKDSKNFLEALTEIYNIAKKATDKTPEQLQVLKDSGVVDSGAYGLTKMIEGIVLALEGRPLSLERNSFEQNNVSNFKKADANHNIGYCTEFFLTLKDPENFKKNKFEKHIVKKLNGNSIVLVVEEDMLKIHAHVKKPGSLLNYAQEFGQFSKIKSENMATQAIEANHFIKGENIIIKPKMKHKELAIIAVSNGPGLDEEFINSGANHIISGGQSMNPSVEDFVKVINSINHKNIVLLPNNANIILTAETTKDIIRDKNIFIIPTKSIQQGLVAIYNINKDMYLFHEYEKTVLDAIKNMSEGQVTLAIRDTELNGIEIKSGEYISIKEKKIICSCKEIIESSKILIKKIVEDGSEVITIIHNKNITLEEIKILVLFIEELNKNIDIEIIFGGQTVYDFLIFGEL